MKKIITLVFVAVVALSASCSALAQLSRKDVHISYEQITTDASFKQFCKASKMNQVEILNFLIGVANEKYLECETIEQLYKVKEHLDIITFYNNSAKQKSIAVTNAIRSLEHKILQTEAEYKKQVVINHTMDNYVNRGQELD